MKGGPHLGESRLARGLSLLTLAAALTSCDAKAPRAPLVVQVDHFFAASAEAETLFRLFRDTFELPEAWPFAGYGDFASGGLSVGNTVVEFATWGVPAGQVLETEWSMLAFEPAGDTESAVAELDRRGISHSKPDVNTYRDAGGIVSRRCPARCRIHTAGDSPGWPAADRKGGRAWTGGGLFSEGTTVPAPVGRPAHRSS